MKINISKLGIYSCFFICLLYILMRPVLVSYVTPLFRYAFVLIMLCTAILSIFNKRVLTNIGMKEILLAVAFIIYAAANAYFFGGRELLGYTLDHYIFYMIPLLVIPYIVDKINWKSILYFVVGFGVVDAAVSIIEFITSTQMFPISGQENDVFMTISDYNIIRTYGLNGNYFVLAEILSVCGLAAFYLFKFDKSKFALISFIVISIGVFTTGSRGYYVSYIIGLLFLYLSTGKGFKKQQIYKVCFILVLITLAVYFLIGTDITTGIDFIDNILSRARLIFDWDSEIANVHRVEKWANAIQSWGNNILFGNGASCTEPRYSHYTSVTESGVLKRLVELGLVGTVLQYATMFVPLSAGVKRYRRSEKKDTLVIFFLSVIITFLVEDIVLQRYVSVEYTIILWTAISYIAYSKGPDAYRGKLITLDSSKKYRVNI